MEFCMQTGRERTHKFGVTLFCISEITNMETVRNTEVIYDKLNVIRICTSGIMHKNGSLICVTITLLFLQFAPAG